MALTQAAFRFRNDDGSQTAATWIDTENTDITLANGSTFRLRIGQTSDGFFDFTSAPWQYQLNGGGWNNITTSSSVVRRVASSFVTHGTATTNQLALAGSFVAGEVVTDGMMLTTNSISSGEKTEFEYCLQLQSGDLVDTDQVEFRSTSGTYSQVPMLTVGSPGPSELTYCAGGDVELEWDTDSWDGPESWVLTESGGDWTLTNGVSTWTATWDGTGSEVFEIASGTDENLTITVTAGACVCKEHYMGAGKKTGLLTTSFFTALIPKNDYRATADPDSTYDKCAKWAAGSVIVNLTNDKVWVCVDASAGAAVWKDVTSTAISDGDKGDITVSSSGATWTIDNNAVTTVKIADANVTTAKLADNAVTTIKITDANVTESKLATNAVTATKIAADAVTSSKILDAQVTGPKLADTSVTEAKIANGAVTLAKQADIATARIMGRVTASTGVQEALTGTQATTLLDVFTTSLKGLAPASGGGTSNFLRADGTWAAPPAVTQTPIEDTFSDMTISTVGSWVDITGASVTLNSSHKYLITAFIVGYDGTNGVYGIEARLHDGTSQVGNTGWAVIGNASVLRIGTACCQAVVTGVTSVKAQYYCTAYVGGTGTLKIDGAHSIIIALRIA